MTRNTDAIVETTDSEPHADQHIDHLKKFLSLESKLRRLNQIEDDIEREEASDLVIKQQIEIMNECADAKADLIQDTLYKLEIWRVWKGEELPHDSGHSEKLVFSVLKDLTNFFGDIPTDKIREERCSDSDASTAE